MKKLAILFVCCLGLSLFKSEAQSMTIYGQIWCYDSLTGILEPALPGTIIIVKGTTNGVLPDLDGKFSLRVRPQDIIEISCMLYRTVTINAYSIQGSSPANPYQIILYDDLYDQDGENEMRSLGGIINTPESSAFGFRLQDNADK